ncbi:hypothetical protein ACFL5F_05790 [Planctomycetota bacterium]
MPTFPSREISGFLLNHDRDEEPDYVGISHILYTEILLQEREKLLRDEYVTTRQTVVDPWAPPNNLGPMVNGFGEDNRPYISADGLSLYFTSERPGGFGDYDLYVSRRVIIENEWRPSFSLRA